MRIIINYIITIVNKFGQLFYLPRSLAYDRKKFLNETDTVISEMLIIQAKQNKVEYGFVLDYRRRLQALKSSEVQGPEVQGLKTKVSNLLNMG